MALKQAFSTTDGVTDLLYVATGLNLCCNPIPDNFTPDMGDTVAPIDPGSLDSLFGPESDFEFRDDYAKWYDSINNIWKDGDPGVVSAEPKALVAAQIEAIRIYNEELAEYNYLYNIQREVQWRNTMAQALIDVCAP